MYSKVAEKFAKLKLFSEVRDDDTIDQLHHRVLTVFLLFMAAFFSAKTKWGSIDCWVPKEYNDDQFKDYAHQLCWISNLYRVPFSDELPFEVDDRMSSDRSINFYRWVFLMFIVHAFMFKLPNIIWRSFKTMSGIDLRRVVEMSLETQWKNGDERDKNMNYIANYIAKWLKSFRNMDDIPQTGFMSKVTGVFWLVGTRSGRFLTRLYLFVKLLYLANVLVQFQIVSSFLGFNYWTYGTEIAQMLVADAPWKDLNHFPRVGMCDFEIRQLQNIQRHTVQCSLPINMYLEKAYAALWFVFVIMAAATALSFLKWLVAEMFTTRREKFLNKYIHMLEEQGEYVDTRLFKRFIRGYLRDDGIFLMRVLTNNAGDIHAFDILKILWYKFGKENHKTDDEELSLETKPLRNGPPE